MSVISVPRPSRTKGGGPPSVPPSVPPLVAGDTLDQRTFHQRYEAMPPGFRAELIGGIVYVASPVRLRHGRPFTNVVKWLAVYEDATPGTEALVDVTTILGDDSEPQPDALLRLVAGQTRETDDDYLAGPPEFVVEIAAATESYDLHAKLRDYERYGVKEYLAMIVRTAEAAWFDRANARLVRRSLEPDGVLRSRVFPGLWLDPAALFGGDMRRVRAVLKRGMATPEYKAFAASLKPKPPPAGTRPSPRSGRRSKR